MPWPVWLVAGLMVAGLFFGYYVALPAAAKFLTHFDSSIYDVQIQARPYISFATMVLLAIEALCRAEPEAIGSVASPATRSAGGWFAICTTARSSGSCTRSSR